jgi:HSP20 family protein
MDQLSGHFRRSAFAQESPFAGVFPLINLTEDPSHYYIRAELPGIKADALDVQVVGKKVALSGERNAESPEDGVRYHRRERDAGKFSRVVTLPKDIQADKVEAKLAHGLLTLTIPKSEAAKPRQISIH